jgi:hypothetical protein
MDDQTIIFTGMYSRKPRNFRKKYGLNKGTEKEKGGEKYFFTFFGTNFSTFKM